MVRLDTTQSEAALSSNQAQFEALNIKIRRLQAELRGVAPNFPNPSSRVMADQISIERALYASRQADLSSLTQAAQARINQAQRSIAEAQATHAARVAARDSAQTEVGMLRPLVDRGIEPQFSLTQAQDRLAVAGHDAEAASASIGRAQASVAEAQASLNQGRQDWRSRAADELASIQAQESALRRNLPAYADRLQRTIVRAPRDGRIHRLLVSTVGGTIGARRANRRNRTFGRRACRRGTDPPAGYRPHPRRREGQGRTDRVSQPDLWLSRGRGDRGLAGFDAGRAER